MCCRNLYVFWKTIHLILRCFKHVTFFLLRPFRFNMCFSIAMLHMRVRVQVFQFHDVCRHVSLGVFLFPLPHVCLTFNFWHIGTCDVVLLHLFGRIAFFFFDRVLLFSWFVVRRCVASVVLVALWCVSKMHNSSMRFKMTSLSSFGFWSFSNLQRGEACMQ